MKANLQDILLLLTGNHSTVIYSCELKTQFILTYNFENKIIKYHYTKQGYFSIFSIIIIKII